MSVIPLKIDGPQPTVVQTPDEFEQAGARKGHAVMIHKLDPSQLTKPGAPNATYDLRIGDQYRDHRKRRIRGIPENGSITFRPGAALIIKTEETLHLPCSMYGTIAPKVSLLQKGLSSTFSKVDPGYNGPLLITVFNLGKATVPLCRREAFCALTIFEVAPGVVPYGGKAKDLEAEPDKQPRQGIGDWVLSHSTLVAAGVSLLMAIANVILFFASRRH